jgi:anaerobic magnesium-protoporphyrin IX monomethyl ester cyclase
MANACDITLLNLNLLYIRYGERVEKEMHLPLGCLYLTRALEAAGFAVDFRDYQTNEFDDPFELDNMVAFLKDPAPIIGLSCMANLLPFTILAMQRLRARYPDRVLVLGGVGPFAVGRLILERFPWIDVVATGEGELSGPQLLAALKNGHDLSSVPGIVYRDQGGIVQTHAPRRIHDLDAIPFPPFERVDLKRYAGYGMMTSRGCPYLCAFCSVAPIWNRESYFRSGENIVAEMRELHEKAGANLFLFQDEFFLSGRERMMDFCKTLRSSGLKVQWKAFGRVNLVDPEAMRTMADAGCIELRFGIESGSDAILQRTKKGFTSEQAVEVISQAVKIFDRVDAFFVWGFPFETMADFYQSVFQMVSFRMMGARILPSLLCLLPQTEIYEEWKTKAKLEFCHELLPEYMFTGHEICRSARISVKAMHRPIFDFISRHPDIFPGFFHIDLETNVWPKLKILQKFGFYPPDQEKNESPESCGAHSPKTVAPHHLATRV